MTESIEIKDNKKNNALSTKDHECFVSTGIHDGLTFGSGELDEYGYWEFPCHKCAREHEKNYPEDGKCWPFAEDEKEIKKDQLILRVSAAAIKRYKDGKVFSIPPPSRHCDIIKLMIKEEGWDWRDEQGFLLSDGRFVIRADAMSVALKANQIISSNPRDDLYSEDLW